MKQITVQDMKSIQLDMLESFIRFCTNKHLKYYLAFGSVLGAVRHKGFIPWDDDIDVMMPREDYEEFVSSYSDSQYCVFDCWHCEGYQYPFAKISDTRSLVVEKSEIEAQFGIYIDVFPIDKIPTSKARIWLIYARRKYLNIKMISRTAMRNKKRTIIKKLLLQVIRFFFQKSEPQEIGKQIDLLAKKNSKAKLYYYSGVVDGIVKRETLPSDFFENSITEKFETLVCKIPADYDTYLKNRYGNYMTLPAENERVYKHDLKIFIKD